MAIMNYSNLALYLGLGFFFLWAGMERAFQLTGQQQTKGKKQALESFLMINIIWYGSILYSFFDNFNLNWTVLNQDFWLLRTLGILFSVSGLIIRFISRRQLGKSYSAHIESSPDHILVKDGIYSWLRHPAYLGLGLLFLGIPFCLGSWGGALVAGLMGLPSLVYRIKIEEQALLEWFGNAYKQYSQETWRMIPYLW